MKKLVFVSVSVAILSFNSFADADFSYKPYNDIEWLNLLHYDNNISLIDRDSDFFLSGYGYKNPKAEYEKAIELLQDKSLVGDKSIQCAYPARTQFILKHNKNLQLSKQNCVEYDEFNKNVPIDYIEIGFAAENNKSPISMMGHAFLILNGTKDDTTKKHIFAYSANISDVSTFSLIFNGLFFGLNGAYVLKPYNTYSVKYLQQEQRSIWKFRVDLGQQQIQKLKKHLWELKQHNIQYSLVFHNCNTATISLLKVADKNLKEKSYGFVLTPIEYIQQIADDNKITDVRIEPTDAAKKVIEAYGLNYILDANKPSKFSVGYVSANKQDGLTIKFSPVYQDIYDVTSAYFDVLESKMLNIRFDYLFNNNKIILNELNIIKLSSITDTFMTRNPAKYINLSLSNTPLNNHTALYPVAELGLGIGFHTGFFKAYITPIIGYQYRHQNIFYVFPEVGLISQIDNELKLLVKYNPYLNILGNQNKYDSITGYIGYKPFNNLEIFIEYKNYYKLDNSHVIKAGISKYF